MNLFHDLWGVNTPDEARAIIKEQCAKASASLNGRPPANVEEAALATVGREIYETFIKGYTENRARYLRYKELADREKNVLFGGRLAEYRYYDMAPAIESAMRLLKNDQIPVPLLAANLEKPKCDR